LVDSSDIKPDAPARQSAGAWGVRANPSPSSARQAEVDALVAEAGSIKRLDYDRLKTLAESAYEIACQADDNGTQYRFGMASALALLAHLSSVLGDSDAALQEASQAMALLDSHEPSAVLGNLYLTMGWAHYQTGDYVDALSDLVTAQHIAERIDDPSLTAYVMDRVANVYHATDRAALALDLQERALSIHRELGDTTGEAIVLNNMTYTLLDLGRYDDALGTVHGALHWAENEERLYLLMGVLDTVAEVYRRRGDLDTAAEYSARGRALADEHRSEPDRGDALLTTALIALERERYDEALAAAEQALAISEKHGRSIEEFTCHELLSRIQERRGDTVSALAHHRRYHELERVRLNEETAARLASLQVEHEVATARKDAEIHRLRSLALQQEVEQQRIAQTQLEAQASLDPLTGLFNRRHVSVLAEDLDRELVQGRQASVILFDIDRFKEINDTHGHFAGDRALVAIARLLRENARDSDTPVRYGGDEFLVLLSGTGTEKAREMAERLRLAIATKPVSHRGVAIPLTVSVGVATVDPGAPIGMLGLIERADRALYAAKRAGRNCVVTDS
jgi:diguanylate cyclase (GGDEF)-like protein